MIYVGLVLCLVSAIYWGRTAILETNYVSAFLCMWVACILGSMFLLGVVSLVT